MRGLVSLKTPLAPLPYLALAPGLVLAQHGAVAWAHFRHGAALEADWSFWLLPLRRLSLLPDLSPTAAAATFAFSLLAAWALAVLSFKRALWSRRGYELAVLTVVPVLNAVAAAMLAPLWKSRAEPDGAPEHEHEHEREERADLAHIMQGIVAGVAILVFAVLVSAVSFGAYGWGLFVLTPFTMELCTAYIANRRVRVSFGHTCSLVMAAAAIGGGALILFALEGLMCILLIAPLAAVVAVAGGALGWALAAPGLRRGKPYLSTALLPAVFAMEAAMPPAAQIRTDQSIEIAAPADAVWAVLTSHEPIEAAPGLVGHAGLAYATRGEIVRAGAGGERIGFFSTGEALERITEWAPGRRLAFEVLTQPPAMEEMSPYRRVHAPHVRGYFETERTSFELTPTPGGGTRLTARASHVLRIDPVLYWEPVARWAVSSNTQRVLGDIRQRAEAAYAARLRRPSISASTRLGSAKVLVSPRLP